jgi:coenzyme F420-reducing hydrogenase beta subunit
MRYDEEMEHVEVLQRLNQVVRRRNKQLRTAVVSTRLYADAVVTQLCEAPSAAQNALEKIRTLGGINCGPDDYDTIVEKAIQARNMIGFSQERSESGIKGAAPIGQ